MLEIWFKNFIRLSNYAGNKNTFISLTLCGTCYTTILLTLYLKERLVIRVIQSSTVFSMQLTQR